ncbi:MAG TPA: hypothetical protein VMT52_05815 [Planctomycetota bacterium]|nr:hypothetical protein [Planctomycetota bacterium]
MARRKKVFVAALGLATIVILAGAGIAVWPSIEREYHLLRLRRKPQLFERLLLSEVPARAAAARAYSAEPAGRDALMDLYLKEYDRSQPNLDLRSFVLRQGLAPGSAGALSLWEAGMSCQMWTGKTGYSQFSFAGAPDDPRRRAIILDLLDSCAGHTLSVRGFEKLEFLVAAAKEGATSLSEWSGADAVGKDSSTGFRGDNMPPGAKHVCFFRQRAP